MQFQSSVVYLCFVHLISLTSTNNTISLIKFKLHNNLIKAIFLLEVIQKCAISGGVNIKHYILYSNFRKIVIKHMTKPKINQIKIKYKPVVVLQTYWCCSLQLAETHSEPTFNPSRLIAHDMVTSLVGNPSPHDVCQTGHPSDHDHVSIDCREIYKVIVNRNM